MTSDSPRSRIDQYYASRKRKTISPDWTSRKTEKEAKSTFEGSPSAKGTLDNYLKTSRDKTCNVETLRVSIGLPSKQNLVRRNLELEIPNSSENEKKTLQSSRLNAMTDAKVGGILKDESQVVNRDANDSPGGYEKDCSGSVVKSENSELKQFATSFLSLYCSELQSIVDLPSEAKTSDHKRPGSPLLLDGEAKRSDHGPCISSKSSSKNKITSSYEKAEDIESAFARERGEFASSYHNKVAVNNSTVSLQLSLRKCNKASKTSVHEIECQTPGLSSTKTCANETPKSSGGSSLFSPGDAFWNEAIQVADGLFVQTDNPGLAEVSKVNALCDSNNSYSVKNNDCNEKAKGAMMDSESSVRSAEVVDTNLEEKPKNDFGNEASPLPVKHLDFTFEENKLDGRAVHHCVSGNPVDVIGKKTRLPERGSGICKPRQMADTVTQVQVPDEISGKEDACYHSKLKDNLDLLHQDKDSMIPVSPVTNISKPAHPSESHNISTPSSILPYEDCSDLSHWLPSEVCSIYRKKGISKLYPWQVECLQMDGVLQKRNLVYCASTSAGKSFVAEILMLRRVLTTEKMALLVLPYVSICAEKAEHLEVLLEPLGKPVRSYYGNQGGGTLPRDTSVAVCTIEKANSLVNRLLEEGRLSEVGIIVIDELHMVGDQSRGYLLELLLTKLRYAVGEGVSDSSSSESLGTSSSKADPASGLQIVGMSATMPNVGAVADWLQAALYQTDFRPVPLEEFIKVGNTIYNKKLEVVRTLSRTADLGGKDPDHIVELCNEVVQEGHSVLIFCSSRKGCESTARHVSKFIKRFAVSNNAENESMEIATAIDALRKSPAGVDPTLEETLPSGVAYHHAGLTVEEREIVEACYRKGFVRVLTATSTLAAGVNLPARRVIFRQPMIGRDFIDGTRYKQMAGRAGRTGIDTKGESVLICKPTEIKRVAAILNESCPPLQSCLSEDKNGMTHAILEVVAGGIVQTANDIHRYVRCTLLNSTRPFQDVVKSAQDSLRWLCHRRFLEWNEETKLYSITPLGHGAFGSSLCPEESLIVLDDLLRAREGFVLASDLHLVYLVTPINVDVEPNWELYYERFMELSALEQSVGNKVGVAEPFLMRMAHGAPLRTFNKSRDHVKGLHGESVSKGGNTSSNLVSDGQLLRVCKRFYVALILSKLVQEVPIVEVCEAFRVARGMVQGLQENAGRFASMVAVFCERLGWHDLESLVSKFQNRVSFGVRAEIAELTTIPYVKGSRARALYKAGLRTHLAIAEAAISEIVKALFESSSWAEEGSAQRRIQLGIAKKIKNGARKIVLEKAEEARVAAFSALKSLGLNVPQLSQPLPLNAASSPNKQEESGEDISIASRSPDDMANYSGMFNISRDYQNIVPESGEKVTKSSGTGIQVSSEMNLTTYLPASQAERALVCSGKLETTYQCAANRGMNFSAKVGMAGPGEQTCQMHDENGPVAKIIHPKTRDIAEEKGPISAANFSGGLDSFLDLWESTREFHFDIHYNKRSGLNSLASFEIHGIAICWDNSPIYYVNLAKDLFLSGRRSRENLSISTNTEIGNAQAFTYSLEIGKDRWKRIGEIMGKKDVRKFAWNLKVQIQVLKNAAIMIQRCLLNLGGVKEGLDLIDGSHLLLSPIYLRDSIDVCIVAWILWPDEGRSSKPNLEKEVKKRLPIDAAAAAARSGRWKNQMRRVAHNGCCRRVAQIRALCCVLWKILISEELVEVLLHIETPLVNVLADMELCGIGVDIDGCLQARDVLQKKLRSLEKEAYRLAGMKFSLYNTSDIANVLYGHLRLPVPEGQCKGKLHPSTDKQCLDLLRNEHPIIPVIKEHRCLAKLFHCTLGAIYSLARLCISTQRHTLHGHWLQTSTATGRLSMEEPNLQCVEHEVEFKLSEDRIEGNSDDGHHKINARNFFIPTQVDWLLLTADYSQIELRLMAHFSRDPPLIELLSKAEGDVFTMIAARWTGRPEDCVVSHERDQTKKLVYGILYGMGANTLGEQLNCSSEEAKEKIKSFKSSFPSIDSWLQEMVSFCQQKGYIVTLKGRKRFLSKIKFGNNEEKSKAERQAVNSICQGSAADIIKIAMIRIHSVIVGDVDTEESSSLLAAKYHMLKNRCRILLQVHDELVLEVDPRFVKEAALMLRTSMETAASLLVPLHVKLKVGRTWGSLEPIQADPCINVNEAVLPGA